MKPIFVKCPFYETYNSKKVKKEHKEEKNAAKETKEDVEEAPVFLVAHVNNILLSYFSYVEVHMKNQQIFNWIGLYFHKSYYSNIFNATIPEFKGVLLRQGYKNEQILDEVLEARLS